MEPTLPKIKKEGEMMAKIKKEEGQTLPKRGISRQKSAYQRGSAPFSDSLSNLATEKWASTFIFHHSL